MRDDGNPALECLIDTPNKKMGKVQANGESAANAAGYGIAAPRMGSHGGLASPVTLRIVRFCMAVVRAYDFRRIWSSHFIESC
jgi:hypothetical protein